MNKTQVEFRHAKVTGLVVKDNAIKKGVAIKPDFVLFENQPDGKKKQVADDQTVRLHRHPETSFTCVGADDHS